NKTRCANNDCFIHFNSTIASIYFIARISLLNSFSAKRLALSANRSRYGLLLAIDSIAAANCSGLSGSMLIPHCERSTNSLIQPFVDWIIGTPAAKESNILFGELVCNTGRSLNVTNVASTRENHL